MNIWERLFGGGLKSPLASREAPARALQQPPTSEKEKGRNVTITPADKKIVFTGFTDPSIPESLRKYFFRYINCSTSERSSIENNLKKRGAEILRVKGHEELAFIFPGSQKVSDSCGDYLNSVAVEIRCFPNRGLEGIAETLLAYQA